MVTICFTGCAPSRILAERKKRKKKNINPFYSFVTFTFCLSDWSFCDSNCPLQMSRTGLWFSISLKFSVLFDLNLRNLFVEFRLAQLLHNKCLCMQSAVCAVASSDLQTLDFFFLMYILTNQFHTSFTASSSTVIHT